MEHQLNEAPESGSGIEFAAWSTIVENDELHLVGLRYGGGSSKMDFPNDGFSIELPGPEMCRTGSLEATFLSREKRAAVVFHFESVGAFRVLDEHGLLDMWGASARLPRPASTTFRVRGHKWQEESALSWEIFDCEFSFMIATDWDCLEVVSASEPTVALHRAIVTEHRSGDSH
jgi:hypothetical protein